MAQYWPILVGINQYTTLPPLMYAQYDALELKDFLVNEAGLGPERCTLLTDVSPMVYAAAAFPTKDAILQQIQRVCSQAGPEDVIWFFFSGYGLHWEGQDWLLPIDGDHHQPATTAIALQTVFEQLAHSAPAQCVVMLDMNRTQAADGEPRLGVQVQDLAKSLGIALVLSCQPDEVSQETLAVRHGLFTQALLEGMRFHGCLTLSQVVAYLSDRVPELCQHHWRPPHYPLAVLPPQHQFLLLLPPSAVTQLGPVPSGPGAIAPDPLAPVAVPPTVRLPGGAVSMGGGVPAVPQNNGIATDHSAPDPGPDSSHGKRADGPEDSPEDGSDGASLGWLRWGLLAAGLLLVGVLVRNPGILVGQGGAEVTPNGAPPDAPIPDGPLPEGDSPAGDTIETDPGPPQQTLFPADAGSVAPISPLERAQMALETQQFGEALSWLEQIPPDQRGAEVTALFDQAQEGYLNSDASRKAVLTEARRIIEPLPASLFNDAIEQARQVPLGDPYYPQAQEDINRWSLVILDLAAGRAATGNFDQAIGAAQLVPDDRGAIYQQAQTLIQQWQQQQAHRQTLLQAQAMLVPDQATTFADAIVLVQQIPSDSPEAPTAQARISQWSQDILVIARARAAAGQYEGAIAAAELVPPGTPAFAAAQEEIQRWQP